jgi:outer membrane protein TolC
MVAHLENNDKMAKAALSNTMGLEWQVPVELASNEIPYVPYKADLKNLISSSYAFNPDWAKLKAGLEASEAQIKEARSGHLPKVALTGSLNHIDNSYNQGLVSARNKDSWMAGVVVELPLFSGFLTQNKIREARAGLAKIKEEQILLKEGLALQVKEVFYRLLRAQDQYISSREARLAAEENRDLNERAYQNELVETKDVLEAQLMESFLQAQHYKVLYDHVEAKAHLSLVIGKEINKLLE